MAGLILKWIVLPQFSKKTSLSFRYLASGHEGATVPVHLQARVNEVGVLELWFVSRDDRQRWKLEFNVRSRD